MHLTFQLVPSSVQPRFENIYDPRKDELETTILSKDNHWSIDTLEDLESNKQETHTY